MPVPWRMVLVPAAITLAVTLLRLYAELQGWSPTLASSEGGAPGALLGISWLMFVFGGWFGYRLRGAGLAPPRPGRTALWMFLVNAATLALGFATLAWMGGEEPLQAFPEVILVNSVTYCIGAAIAYRLWPALGALTMRYGILARAPVIVLTVVAVHAGWGTHYEKLGPGEGLPLPAWERIAWLSLAQACVWVPFTILFGGLVGSLLAWLRPQRGARPAATAG